MDGMVEIWVRGRPFLGFSEDDPVGRDVVIATLLRARIKGTEVTRLVGVSSGHVSQVKKRFESGGLAALAVRGRPGPKPQLTAAQVRTLEQMSRAGKSLREVGAALGVAPSCVHRYLVRSRLAESAAPAPSQESLLGAMDAPPERETMHVEPEPAAPAEPGVVDELAAPVEPGVVDKPAAPVEPGVVDKPAELCAATPLRPSATKHPTRYAGTLLLGAALHELGVGRALAEARATRPGSALYTPATIAMTLASAWGAGFPSLEAMHEGDAHSLGVVLGLERSPSVRTLHRAIRQMSSTMDATIFGRELMHGLRRSLDEAPTLFGVDGHFKAYGGKAPIDKGWDSKRRTATKGLHDIVVTDTRGRTWAIHSAGAGDALSQHVLEAARGLRRTLGVNEEIVVAIDRGGFDFDVLNALASEHFRYVIYVPDSVKLPDLEAIAPVDSGIAEASFAHSRVAHAARLLVQRDGDDLIPAATNLPADIAPSTVMRMLRRARGTQENSFKAARQHAHIDRLSDRGSAFTGPDHRLVDNPEYRGLRKEVDALTETLSRLDACEARCGDAKDTVPADFVAADFKLGLAKKRMRDLPARVERIKLDPSAQRAVLPTRNRALLLPLKYASENARRWCVDALSAGLAPSDREHDSGTEHRTLTALLKAPGTVELRPREVLVTIDLPLPPTPHARLAAALEALDARKLRFADGRRAVKFRLGERVTRDRIGL
jgi:transposase